MYENHIIDVNGKKMTIEDFEKFKESISKLKDCKLVEISPNIYKTRLFG